MKLHCQGVPRESPAAVEPQFTLQPTVQCGSSRTVTLRPGSRKEHATFRRRTRIQRGRRKRVKRIFRGWLRVCNLFCISAFAALYASLYIDTMDSLSIARTPNRIGMVTAAYKACTKLLLFD